MTRMLRRCWKKTCHEGEAYGRALAEAGSRVIINRLEGAIHGFISHPGTPEFECACELMRDFLNATENKSGGFTENRLNGRGRIDKGEEDTDASTGKQ